MKDRQKKLLTFLIIFFLLYILTTVGVNFVIFHKLTFFTSPFTSFRLFKVLPKIAARKRLLLSLVSYGQMIFLLLFSVLFAFGKQIGKWINIEDPRLTSQGSAKWVSDRILKKNNYMTKSLKDLDVIIGCGNDAVMEGNADAMKTKRKSRSFYGYRLEKEVSKGPKIRHMMLIGSSGSGKNAGMGTPTLLNYKGSAIIFDPAGENYADTAGWRTSAECDNGYVQFFDPQNKNSTLHFNPLDWIRFDAKYISLDVDNLCSIIIPNNPDAKDPFWDNSARTFLKLLMGYVLLTDKLKKSEKNLFNIANLISVLSRQGNVPNIERCIKSLVAYQKALDRETDDEKIDFYRLEIEKTERKIEEIKKAEEDIAALKERRGKTAKNLKDLSKSETGYVERGGTKIDVRQERRKFEDLLREIDEDLEAKWRITGTAERRNDNQPVSFIEFVAKLKCDLEEQERNFKKDEREGWQGMLMSKTLDAMTNIQTTAKAETTLATIVSVLNTSMSFFVEPVMAELMKDTSFSTDDLIYNDAPLSLYLCISPNDIQRCQKFIQLFVQSVFNKLYTNQTDEPEFKRYKRYGKHTVLFFLDEFVQLGKFDTIVQNIPYCRKFGIAFIFIVQGKTHLESLYKKEGTDAILSNCHVVNVKGCAGEIQTAEWTSQMLGKKTLILTETSASVKGMETQSHSVSEKEVARSLMTADEILHMENWEQVVLFNGLNGLKCKKIQWFEDEHFLKRVGAKPDGRLLPFYESEIKKRQAEEEQAKEISELVKWTLEKGKEMDDSERAYEDYTDEIYEEKIREAIEPKAEKADAEKNSDTDNKTKKERKVNDDKDIWGDKNE